MKKDYLLFVICCLLYILLSAIDLFFFPVDVLYLSLGSILVLTLFLFVVKMVKLKKHIE